MSLRRWIVLAFGLVAAIGIIAAAYVVTQPREQIAMLPTLAILPTETASLTPTDPPTHSPTPVIVVKIVTATPPPASATPIPSATASSTPTSTASPSATITDTQTPALTTAAPTLTPTATSTDGVQAISPQTYFVTVGSANMRACPRRDCSIVAPLMRGNPVTVVGYTVGDTVSGSNIWFSVHLLNYQGYVHSSLLALTMPATATFTPAPVQIYIPPTAPSGSGILCADGTISYAQSRSGACSYHGGIAGDSGNSGGSSSSPPTSAPSSGDTSGGFLCADGTTSHAAHRQGACSHHGGIAPGH